MLKQPAYNKTSVRLLEKQILLRQKALPPLKMRETALRAASINKTKELKELMLLINESEEEIKKFHPLLSDLKVNEFSNFTIEIKKEKIAGVRVPVLSQVKEIVAEIPPHAPYWLHLALPKLNTWYLLNLKVTILQKAVYEIENARKKITRKINLFEKVQIPLMEMYISKIKIFLNDTEALSSAIQKLSKKNLEQNMDIV